jgi:predicted cupin superfamily sugar epimerase
MRTMRLGPDLAQGEVVGIVPEQAWQSARACSDYALVSCTVTPGFEIRRLRPRAAGFPADGARMTASA